MYLNDYTATRLSEQRLTEYHERARRDSLALRPLRALLARMLLNCALRLEPALAPERAESATLSGI